MSGGRPSADITVMPQDTTVTCRRSPSGTGSLAGTSARAGPGTPRARSSASTVTSRFSTAFTVAVWKSWRSRRSRRHVGIGTGSPESCFTMISWAERPPITTSPVRHSRKMSAPELLGRGVAGRAYQLARHREPRQGPTAPLAREAAEAEVEHERVPPCARLRYHDVLGLEVAVDD